MRINPAEADPVQMADWTELEVLYSNKKSISFEAIRAFIDMDGTLGDYEEIIEDEIVMTERIEETVVEDAEEGLIEDEKYIVVKRMLRDTVSINQKSEELVASMVSEIDRRIAIVGIAYPFEKKNGRLILKKDYQKCIPYIFCLLSCDREYYSPGERKMPRLFEHLVKEALAVYLGGKAIRFGWPRDKTMPKGIDDAIKQLSKMIKDEKIGLFPMNETDKDLGLDVVGWKDFPDGNSSKVEIFMQCATGEDWEGKRGECNIVAWNRIISCSNDRLKGFAIPYVIGEEREWKRIVNDLIFMDRVRIASILKNKKIPDEEFCWWDWCEDRLKKVENNLKN